MKKLILLSLILVAIGAHGKTLITQDGRMSLLVSDGKIVIRTPEADDVLPCVLAKQAPGTYSPQADKWDGYFYQCSNGLTVSVKHYTFNTRKDEVFIFEGEKVMYTDQLQGKLK